MAATAAIVDLSGVSESGGGSFRPRRKPEGDYRMKIVKVEDHQPKDANKPKGWVYTIQVEGDQRSSYPYYVNPAPKEAWKIRAICVAAGINVKLSRIKFDPNKLVGKMIGAFLEDDEYEGREKSVIGDVFPVGDVGGNADETEDVEDIPDDQEIEEDEEEEAPAPVRKRRKPAPEPEPEDEEEEEEEEPVKPVRRRKAKPAPEPEPEDDEEEDEPAPVRKRTPAKATRPRKAASVVEEEDDEDDLDLDDLD